MNDMFKYTIINFITTIISITLVFFLIGLFFKDDISNIYDIYNKFKFKDLKINDYNASFNKLTIKNPSISGLHNFKADKMVIDGFMLLENNDSILGK